MIRSKVKILVKKHEAEQLAPEYARKIGMGPFEVYGSEFDETEDGPIWTVFLVFTDSLFEEFRLPDSTQIKVNPLTGDASHIMSL